MSTDRYDAVLLSLAQQMEGGVPELLDVLFSFLARKTDFFSGAGDDGSKAKEMTFTAFNKYASDCQAIQAAKEREKAARQEQLLKSREMARDRVTAETTATVEEVTDDEAAKIEADNAVVKETPSGDTNVTPAAGDADENDEEDSGKMAPNSGNGASTGWGSWTQTLGDLEVGTPLSHTPASLQIRVPLKCKVKSRDCVVKVAKKSISVGLKNATPLVDGPMYAEVKLEELNWTLEDGHTVVITVDKFNQMEWWPHIVTDDPLIDTKKVSPENSKLSDLDGDTRQMVEKMMHDQRQKELGLPTSEEAKKQQMLNKFMKAHPEMDFSNAKIN